MLVFASLVEPKLVAGWAGGTAAKAHGDDGGEGFLSDSFVGVASLSQAGSERRVSHDAGVDVLAE